MNGKGLMTVFLKTISLTVLAVGILAAGAFLSANPSQAAAVVRKEDKTLEVQASQSVMVRLDKEAKSIYIANPNIADIQIKSARLIYIFGQSPGSTTFYAVDKDDNIIYSATVVVNQDVSMAQATIDKLIPSASITVQSVNGIILLTGYAEAQADADLAQQIVQQMLVSQSSGSRGSSSTLQEQRVINRISIQTPNQVNLRVKIAEMSRSTLKQLGFNWQAAFAGAQNAFGFTLGRQALNFANTPTSPPFTPTESGIGSLGFTNVGGKHSVGAVLDALEDEGFVSILAEPNITAMSGETASFLAGGEFPIPIPQGGISNAITVTFKQFGVQLQFTPTIMAENRITLKVAPEVSQLSSAGSTTVNGFSIPALTTRRAITTVELGSGESFAIAGLLQSNINQTASKFPWLGDIPILGTLFRSDKFTRDETELVIIVTPYIVRPVTAAKLIGPTDINDLPSDAGYYVKGRKSLAGNGGLKVDK